MALREQDLNECTGLYHSVLNGYDSLEHHNGVPGLDRKTGLPVLDVLPLDPDVLIGLIHPSENASMRSLDSSIAKRRPYISSLDEMLHMINQAYPMQLTPSGLRRAVGYEKYASVRGILVAQRKGISAAQARDRLTFRELYS